MEKTQTNTEIVLKDNSEVDPQGVASISRYLLGVRQYHIICFKMKYIFIRWWENGCITRIATLHTYFFVNCFLLPAHSSVANCRLFTNKPSDLNSSVYSWFYAIQDSIQLTLFHLFIKIFRMRNSK